MLNQDLAESPLASHRDLPSDHVDGYLDFLRDAFAQFSGPLPATRDEFRSLCQKLISAGVEEAQEAGVETGSEADCGESNSVVQGLQVIAELPHWQIAGPAICYLRLLGKEPRSFEQIGQRFGRTRASVNTLYRKIQKLYPKLRSRGDKSEASRAECRLRRIGARKARFDVSSPGIWKPLPLLPQPLPRN